MDTQDQRPAVEAYGMCVGNEIDMQQMIDDLQTLENATRAAIRSHVPPAEAS